MKTIAILTDFSPASEHAAQYGVHLAQKIRARVVLYAASPIPSGATTVAKWPDYADGQPVRHTTNLLDKLAEGLHHYITERSFAGAFIPSIEASADEDVTTRSLLALEEGKDSVLLVLAANPGNGHGSATSTAWWRKAVEAADTPVLIVPENAAIRNVERFVFATEAEYGDIEFVNNLSNWATFSTAEIMVACSAQNEIIPKTAIPTFKEKMLAEVDYGRIYYRTVPSTRVKTELDWLIENRSFDMLAMVHRKGTLSNLLFNRGIMEALLYRKCVPVLVYPGFLKNKSSAKCISINTHDHETYNQRRIA